MNLIEGNYTKTPNEILDKLSKAKLTGTQFNLLNVITRYTFGFQREKHNLSLQFLTEATNRDKRQLQRELKELENRNIIFQKIGANKRIISINNNYEEWNIGIGKPTNGKPTNGKPTNGKPTNGKPTNPRVGKPTNPRVGKPTNQETIKEKYKETGGGYSEDFKLFWDVYPRKDSKAASYKRFKKALKHHTAEELIKAASNYAESVSGTESKFIKVANNFFGDEVYLDYINMEPSYVEVENWRGSDKRL